MTRMRLSRALRRLKLHTARLVEALRAPIFERRALMAVVGDDLCVLELKAHSWISSATGVSLQVDLLGAEPVGSPQQRQSRFTAPVLLVPDYWLDTLTHPVPSARDGLVEAFVRNKLRASHPSLEGVERYFKYGVRRQQPRGFEVTACHIAEARGLQLLGELAAKGLRMSGVTSPGLIWSGKLVGVSQDFAAGTHCLVHLSARECFLYFYHQGTFLFSRRLQLPDGLGEGDDALWVYELNQSLYLVSQRVKAEVERIFVCGASEDAVDALSARLSPTVVDLGDMFPKRATSDVDVAALEYFDLKDILGSDGLGALVEREVWHERVWQPAQRLSLGLGVGMCLVMAAQAVFLTFWPAEAGAPPFAANVQQDNQARDRLNGFRSDLQTLIDEDRPRRPDETLAALGRATPGEIAWVEVDMEVGTPGKLKLKGAVIARGAAQLEETLGTLLYGLNRELGEGKQLNHKDVDLLGRSPRDDGAFTFEFALALEVS